jgi:hypothetical protein
MSTQFSLDAWILSVLHIIAPVKERTVYIRNESATEMTARYELLAKQMAKAIQTRDKLFDNDADGVKTAALVLSIAKYESDFDARVARGKLRGDNGRSWCYMQMNIGNNPLSYGPTEIRGWKGADLVQDPTKCFIAGIETLRISMSACKYFKGAGQISAYTSGTCQNGEKGAIYRWGYAQLLLKRHAPK